GALCAPNDPARLAANLDRLLQQAELPDLARCARESVRRLAPETMAGRLVALYRALLAPHRPVVVPSL
ncbi:MAG: hypothetical protein N2690_09225, partial [Rhodocyclaceae bacterium]|nr:hypothetical protein [Rhodocyclaceae bacterium]